LDSALRFRDFDNGKDLSYFTSYAVPVPTTNFTEQTLLRGGVVYYVSVRFNITTNSTNTFKLQISWTNTVCGINQIPLPSGKCQSAPINPFNVPVVATNIQPNTPQYFQYNVLADSNQFKVVVNSTADSITAATGSNVQMYARRGAAPSSSLYDAMAAYDNTTNSYILSVYQPIFGTWYLSVVNEDSAPATLMLNATVTSCQNKTFGPNCNISLDSVLDLTNNVSLVEVTGTGNYQYFMVSSDTLIFGAGTEDLDVEGPALTASFFNFPTNQSNLISAQGNDVNFIWSSVPKGVNITWFVSAWFENGETYYVWANVNCPNLCEGDDYLKANATSYGTCNAQTGTCTCDDGYGDLTCTKQGLAVVWIVIIVIATIVILAIAIGVPVACYIKNKKRARYERV